MCCCPTGCGETRRSMTLCRENPLSDLSGKDYHLFLLPLMLNTAKRSRTTVEALEIKGYRYAVVNKEVKKMKLAALKVDYDDLIFVAVSFLWMALSAAAATVF